MKTVLLKEDKVREIIPDYALPVEKWYGAAFAAECMEAPDDVEHGWVYDPTTGEFYEDGANLSALKAERVATTKADLATYLAANPLTWIDGNEYTVTADKQSLLTSQLALYQTAMAAGQPYELKWNPTGGECSVWDYENLVALALAIGQYVQPLVSYQQAKEVEIMGAESVEALEAIVVDYDAVASAV